MMNKITSAKADARRLPPMTTPENLEMNYSTVLYFGNNVLVAGYYYQPRGGCYYGAVYTFTDADHTCEGAVKLATTSEESFEDNGHAIAWCMANCKA